MNYGKTYHWYRGAVGKQVWSEPGSSRLEFKWETRPDFGTLPRNYSSGHLLVKLSKYSDWGALSKSGYPVVGGPKLGMGQSCNRWKIKKDFNSTQTIGFVYLCGPNLIFEMFNFKQSFWLW